MNNPEEPQSDDLTESLENLTPEQALALANALIERKPDGDLSQAKVSRLSSK